MSRVYQIGHGAIELRGGDILEYSADAIVCPTNTYFMIGNLGVSGAIKRAAGLKFLAEVDRASTSVDRIKLGDAYFTSGGELPVKYVIHAVCTGWNPGRISAEREGFYSNDQMIRQSTRNCLKVANGLKLESVGFPVLGTGMGGVPLNEGADIILDEFAVHLKSPTQLRRLGLILFGEEAYGIAEQLAAQKFQ